MNHRFVRLLLALALAASLAPDVRAQEGLLNPATVRDGEAAVNCHASRNFRIVTDLPLEETAELLVRLERMLELVSSYYGPRIRRPIDMYVARKIDDWPVEWLERMAPEGVERIRRGNGFTYSQFLDFDRRTVDSAAVVYTTASDGLPQHEAVHAYCTLAFGRTGPVWYSEGMAEVGRFWRKDDSSVRASAALMQYVRDSEPKSLSAIVDDRLETTDTEENYVWRWALCHLLGCNENYTQRFKPLGLALLTGQDVDFWKVYGGHSPEIEFELRFFVAHIESGYRVDLCSWDWRTDSAAPGRGGTRSRIRAPRGWQASRVTVVGGQEYRFDATGLWSVDADRTPLSADGNDAGGRLVGCVFSEYALSAEFELGRGGTFVAPVDGSLFLRCRDGWGELADNRGAVNVKITPASDGRSPRTP